MTEKLSNLPPQSYFDEQDALALLVPRAKVLAALADACGQAGAAVLSAQPAAPVLDDRWKARMLDGRAIERDEMGLGDHPELPLLDEGMMPRSFFAALGLELVHTSAEDQLDGDVLGAMSEAVNWTGWTPTPPPGDGWKLVSMFDIEEGPVAWWLRELPEAEDGTTTIRNLQAEVEKLKVSAARARTAPAAPSWDNVRRGLTIMMVGFAHGPQPTLEAAEAALDAATEQDMPLAGLRALAAAPQAPAVLDDDIAADTLATAMKAKLSSKRSKGYGGWQGAAVSRQHLSNLLRRHVEKGDPVDVANFCAFLHARGEFIAPPAEPLDPKDAKVGAACNRACIELPPHYEVVISLEKDAGTVHWFDADGNEHSAYADGGFDESINAATDAAIARARESVSE